MKNSLIDQIVSHLQKQYPSWVAKGELTAIQWKDNKGRTYLPETVGRKCREAEELSRIAVKSQGVSVAYKWLPFERRASYIPKSSRLPGEEDKLFR